MALTLGEQFVRLRRFARIFFLNREQGRLLRAARNSGFFDPDYYAGAYPGIHPLFRRFPLRHYIVFGEARGYRPNPDFSPEAYLRYNPDVAATGMSPFLHYVQTGHAESRVHKELPTIEELPQVERQQTHKVLALHSEHDHQQAPVAIAAHIYYPDVWPEFRDTLHRLPFEFDLFITLTYRGDETEALADDIRSDYPNALVVPVENRGRDILPFLTLINAGVLDGYKAICKIHTKKSPHREDGDHWRRHLIDGILPKVGGEDLLSKFLATPEAAFWVADGQCYSDTKWWGTNFEFTRALLRRVEIEIDWEDLYFPAGSIYWVKPIIVGLLKAMRLDSSHFAPEMGQVDGTLAHALERGIGLLAKAGGQEILQTSEIQKLPPHEPKITPSYVSAFYLPQFHPTPENDHWWGRGFTEWRGVTRAQSVFEGHLQPVLPADFGFYDLRVTEVMGEQADMARAAGIDAFCVYHYWFDGRRILEEPLDRLLTRPDVDFPFYLCWANESWRRNWDGLSGTILLEQTYADGFEEQLVADSLPYMRDPRYQRPDGTRPRFVIYRPEDMPNPISSVARMRAAWRAAGIGEVELGAVCFHIAGKNPVPDDLFDFWVEMPPHGMVKEQDYLFGGSKGNILNRPIREGFSGLVYDYTRVVETALSAKYAQSLPAKTICGIMPSWDNTARRGLKAHIAHKANPAAFNRWLNGLAEARLPGSYRNELFVNSWNEWAEKAMMEPSLEYADLYLQVLASHMSPKTATYNQTSREPIADTTAAQ